MRSDILDIIKRPNHQLWNQGSCNHCGVDFHKGFECPIKQRCEGCGCWMMHDLITKTYYCPTCQAMYSLTSDGIEFEGKYYVRKGA